MDGASGGTTVEWAGPRPGGLEAILSCRRGRQKAPPTAICWGWARQPWAKPSSQVTGLRGRCRLGNSPAAHRRARTSRRFPGGLPSKRGLPGPLLAVRGAKNPADALAPICVGRPERPRWPAVTLHVEEVAFPGYPLEREATASSTEPYRSGASSLADSSFARRRAAGATGPRAGRAQGEVGA